MILQRYNLICIICISAIVIYLFTLASFTQNNEIILTSSTKVPEEESKEMAIEKMNKCYIEMFEIWKKSAATAWLELANLVKMCSKDIINFIPILEATPLSQEHKYFMVPNLSFINDTCSIVTFGIGGDIESEEHMRRVLPHCAFLGFDPNEAYEKLFTEKLKGKFVKTAVGGKNENATIVKLDTKTSHFIPTPGEHVRSAVELLKTFHGENKTIDILNVDVEGSEYVIFEQIYKEEIFFNVCQINVEFHPVWYNPSTGHSLNDVLDILTNLIQDGKFIWVRSVVHSSQFFPSYFVNIKNEYCVKKYLETRLF